MNDPLLMIGVLLMVILVSLVLSVKILLATVEDDERRTALEVKFYQDVNNGVGWIMALPFMLMEMAWRWIRGGKRS